MDDGFACGKKPILHKFCEELKAESMSITVEESMGDYLSCEVKFNQDMTKAWLGQPHMVKKLVKTFGDEFSSLANYKTPGTPSFGII